MRQILILVVGLLIGVLANAQIKPVITTTVKIPQALCINCKTRLEYQLKRLDGIAEFLVNYRKGEAKVKYITDRIDIEQIKTAVSNCGYDADDVLANLDAYKRLPLTCKKKIDGGAHRL
jgi:mercuric ion binding protein